MARRADIGRLLREVVGPLHAGIDSRYQAWDWSAMRLGDWRWIPAGGVVVIEGSGSASLEVADSLNFIVWVECPDEVRLQRTLVRDGQQVMGAWDHWTAWEARYLAKQDPRSRADLVFLSSPPAP